jgi:competence ComEA-like helix-hairpin-helix protein
MLVVILSAAKNLSVFGLRCHSERSEESAFRPASVCGRVPHAPVLRVGSFRAGCPMRRCCAWGFSLVMLLALAATAFAQKSPPTKPIDINTATIEQLQQLPGVGPVTAKSIVDFREKSGPFRRIEDLLAIRGISESRFKAIAPYVVVSQSENSAPGKRDATK